MKGMERNILSQAAEKLVEKNRQRRWYRIVSVMAAIVVFVTTYALILPAITMTENDSGVITPAGSAGNTAAVSGSDAGAGSSKDLTGYITEIKGEAVTYNAAANRYDAHLSVAFEIPAEDIGEAGSQFACTLPTGITLPETANGQTYNETDASGNELFSLTYKADASGDAWIVTLNVGEGYLDALGDNGSLAGEFDFDCGIWTEAWDAEAGGLKLSIGEGEAAVTLIIPDEQITYDGNDGVSSTALSVSDEKTAALSVTGGDAESSENSVGNAEAALTYSVEMLDAGVAATSVDAAGSTDLTEYLIGVIITDGSGNLVSQGGTLYDGENYTITLGFAEKASGRQFSEVMTYQLPAGIVISEAINGSILKDGVEAIKYTISESGLLTVEFQQVTDNDKHVYWQDLFANASFTVTISAGVDRDTVTNAGKDDISFSDNYTFEVDTPTVGLDVAKTGSFTKGTADDDGKITTGTTGYQVTVTAKNGDVSGLVITDAFTGTNGSGNAEFALKSDTIVIKDKDGVLVDSSYYKVTANEDGHGFTITFSENYKLLKDETLIITYDVGVSGLDADSDVGFNQYNKVTVEGKTDTETPGEIEKSTEAYTWISVSNAVEKNLSKTGAAVVTPNNAAEDAENGRIQWTVVITDGNGLRGATVKDTLGEGLSLEKDGSIIVQVTYEDGTKDIFEIEETPTETGFEFVLPDKDGNGEELPEYKTATVMYYTSYALDDVPMNASKTYKNTFEVTEDEKGEPGPGNDGYVNIPGVETPPTETTKVRNSDIALAGDTTLCYTITVKVPGLEGGYTPFYVVDSMTVIPEDAFASQAKALKLSENSVVEVGVSITKDDNTEDDTQESKWEIGSDGKLYIYFNGESTEDSHWTIEEDATIEITYKVDLTKLEDENTDVGEGLEYYLDNHGVLSNAATNYYAERSSYDSDDYSRDSELEKSGQIDKDGNISYTVMLEGLGMQTRSQIGSAEEAYFIDYLPDGWEYVSGSLVARPYYRNGETYGELKYIGTDETNLVTVDAEGRSILKVSLSDLRLDGNIGNSDLKNGYIGSEDSGQAALNAVAFTYTLKPTKDWLKSIEGYDVQEVVNRAELTWGDEGDLTVENTVEYGNNPLVKTAEQEMITKEGTEVGTNLFHFTITVNELKDQLLSVAGGALELIDTMDSNLSFDITTLKVVNGEDSSILASDSYDVQYVPDETGNKLTISGLPDNTWLIITYDARVGSSGNVSFSNKVELHGKEDWETQVDVTDRTVSSTGEAAGERGKFYIHKVDADTQNSLKGAEFSLYFVGPKKLSELEDQGQLGSSVTPLYSGIGDIWYDLGSNRIWELDDNPGWFQVGNKMNDGGESQLVLEEFAGDGWRFVLVETKAPEGHELLQDPIVIAYGSGDDNADYTVDYGGTVTVENTPLTTVSVEKVWKNEKGGDAKPTVDSIDVALMQVAHYEYEQEVLPDESDCYTLSIYKEQWVWDNVNYINVCENVLTAQKTIPKGVEVKLQTSYNWSSENKITIIESDGNEKEITGTQEYTENGAVAVYSFTGNIDCAIYFGEYDTFYDAVYDKKISTQSVEKEEVFSTEEYGPYTATLKASADEVNNWKADWENLKLPVSGTVIGADGVEYECTYTYYVKETTEPGDWTVSYTVDGQSYTAGDVANMNITGDTTVTVTNTIPTEESYELPKTGGSGIKLYTFSGIVLVVSTLMYYIFRKRKRAMPH